MSMRMRRMATAMAATAVAATAMAGLASPASAAKQVSCQPAWSTSACTTSAIKANETLHAVHLIVKTQLRGCHYEVRDVNTWVVVYAGDASGGFDIKERWVGGLYGSYRLELTRCGYTNIGLLNDY